MADLGNQKIKNTYQFVLQTDPSGNLQNLSGGTPNPLIVNNNLRYLDGNQADGYVLLSDSSGNASWGPVAFSGDVYVTGGSINSTTIQLNASSGGTVSIPGLSWSSSTSGHISNSGLTGNVGIGTSTPNKPLTVVGDISASTKLYVADLEINSSGYVRKNNDNRIFFPIVDNSSAPNILYGFWGMQDNGHFYWGSDEDLDIYHSGTQGYIHNDTGTLNILSSAVKLGDITSTVTVQDNLIVNDDLTVNTSTLHVNSTNGKVGVGTLNPDAYLTVSGDSTGFTSYNMNGGSAEFQNNNTRVKFSNGANTNDLSPGDRIQVTINGVTYIVIVSTVDNSTNITLTVTFPGQTNDQVEEFNYDDGTNATLFKVYDTTTPVFQVSGSTVMSGSTDLLDIFASSSVTNQDVYWSANTDGSITNSGNTDITTTGNVISANEDVYMFSNRGQGQTDATHWYGPNFQGIYNYSWSKDYGDDTEVLTLDEEFINAGLLVPYDCVLTGFFTIGHSNSGTAGYSCGLWYITQSNLASSLNVTSGVAGDATLTLAGTIGTTVNPGNGKNPLTLDKRASMSVSLTAGSMIYPRVGDSAVVTDTTWNVYLKRT